MTKIETAYTIVDFWHTVEFLTQSDFSKDTRENKAKISKIENSKSNVKSFALFHATPIASVEQLLADDNARFPSHLLYDKIHLCIGKIEREALIQALYHVLDAKDDRPEADKSIICLIGFKVDSAGIYIEQSLQVSPIVWGISRCACSLEITHEAYQADMGSLEKMMNDAEPVAPCDIEKLYNEIWTRFLKPLSLATDSCLFEGTLIYIRYSDQAAFDKMADTAEDYSSLLNGFYLDDLDMIKNYIRKSKPDSPMLKCLLDYITSSVSGINKVLRIDIRDNEECIENCLRIANSPMGKWPSRYVPSLMQQIAVNMSINKEVYQQPIFSVNGPPGTGKTTLLKEIIASNIVERAKFLCRYEKADDAFEKAYFSDGTVQKGGHKGYDFYHYHYYKIKDSRLADYAMLVASCNNAAVENITKELPDSAKLLDGLQCENRTEIAELFDVSKTEDIELYKEWIEGGKQKHKEVIEKKDIYFSYLAQKLMGFNNQESKEAQWGLISAPMGKSSNVRNYYYNVLQPILESQLGSNTKIEARQERYRQSRENFQEQYEKVESIKDALEKISRLPADYRTRKKQHMNNIEQYKKNIEHIMENHSNHVENIHNAKVRVHAEELLVTETKALLNECLLAQESCEEKIKEEERKIQPYSEKLMELEGSRGFTELFLGKWLKTDRASQIGELKNIVQKMRATLTLIQQKQSKCADAVSKVEDQLRSRQGNVERSKNYILQLEQKEPDFEQMITEDNRQIEKLCKAINDEAAALQTHLEQYRNELIPLDTTFWENLSSKDEAVSTGAQLVNPWITEEYNRAREKLFYLALCLHKDFVLSSKACRDNFINLGLLWRYRKGKTDNSGAEELSRFSSRDKEYAYPHLLNTLFLLTPVISTTFASVGRFLSAVNKPGALGTLIIDEAGQASPHVALGALWRCRKAIIVGDPKQVEPVVTGDIDMIKRAFSNDIFKPFQRCTLSVQEFADRINRYGATLKGEMGSGEDEIWIGCPLVVHRRCVDPMFSISNSLSYGNTMRLQTPKSDKNMERKFVLETSCWIDVKGRENGSKNHFVKIQGEAALDLISESFQKYDGKPDLFVISPFTTVINGLKNMVEASTVKESYPEDTEKWLTDCCGTVHKFQGKEAKEVIFLLGCDENALGAVAWVKPNILNVAVTRAKHRLYIIGNYSVWGKSEIFQIAHKYLS